MRERERVMRDICFYSILLLNLFLRIRWKNGMLLNEYNIDTMQSWTHNDQNIQKSSFPPQQQNSFSLSENLPTLYMYSTSFGFGNSRYIFPVQSIETNKLEIINNLYCTLLFTVQTVLCWKTVFIFHSQSTSDPPGDVSQFMRAAFTKAA